MYRSSLRRETSWTLALALFAAGWSAVACSAAGCSANGADGDSAGPGGSASGGSAGAGGADGGSGATPSSLCAADCAQIQVPACQRSVCNEGEYPGEVGACVVIDELDNAECEDGLFCTSGDRCAAGVCVGGPPNQCDITAAPCNAVTCDEVEKACELVAADDGASCATDNLCEVNGTCQSGFCVGQPKDCSFAPAAECNNVACNAATGACQATSPDPAKNGEFCSGDGDPCAVGKTCSNGMCGGGSPKDCSPGTCDTQTGFCI